MKTLIKTIKVLNKLTKPNKGVFTTKRRKNYSCVNKKYRR